MEKQNSEQKSLFNSSISILIRLDYLWKETHNHARSGDYLKWNMDLDRVWCELSMDTKPESDKEFEKISTDIEKTGFIKVMLPNGEQKLKDKLLLYKKLMKKEVFLRRLQNKQGKGMAYEDSMEDYMD